MAEDAPESETPKNDVKVEASDIESQIQTAMRSRVAHFKEQADSLTFEGVRRLLEKDLGLEPYALDVHKRFVKQCLLKALAILDLNAKIPNTATKYGYGGTCSHALLDVFYWSHFLSDN